MMYIYHKAAFTFEVSFSLLPHMMTDKCALTLHTS